MPASAWIAAGGRGAPVVATEAAVLAHLLGLAGDEAKVPDEKWDKKRAANKETSRTRKRKIQEEKEELKALKAKMASQAHSGEGGQKTVRARVSSRRTKRGTRRALAGPQARAHVESCRRVRSAHAA